MKLIDTDIVIDHFHGHRAALEYFASILTSSEILAISVITLTEITSQPFFFGNRLLYRQNNRQTNVKRQKC